MSKQKKTNPVTENALKNLMRPMLNTNTHLDIVTGKYLPGYKGKLYLNGGLHIINGVGGEQQTYKTTAGIGLTSRAFSIQPISDMIVYDTESAVPDIERVFLIRGDLPGSYERKNPYKTLSQYKTDIIPFNKETSMDNFLEKIIEIGEEKLKNLKDNITITPFFNHETGKEMRVLRPTFIVIDSWSAMQSEQELAKYKDHKLSDPEMNRIFMMDGNRKTMFLRLMTHLCYKYGFYFILTSHIGNDGAAGMNRFVKDKSMQYMKFQQKFKGASDAFTFYCLNVFETRKASVMLDNNKKCQYPYMNNIPTELNEVHMVIVKGKNNIAGTEVRLVVSQWEGIQNGLTNLEYLKNLKEGLTGIGTARLKVLMKPDITFTRNNIREHLEGNYELYRALEVTAQLTYILKNWNIRRIPILHPFVGKSWEEIASMFLESKGSIKINDILNSRGYWVLDEPAYEKKLRPYLGLFDILNLLNKK